VEVFSDIMVIFWGVFYRVSGCVFWHGDFFQGLWKCFLTIWWFLCIFQGPWKCFLT
jgi:hypothetical protein